MKNIRQEAATWLQIGAIIFIWLMIQLLFLGRMGIDAETLKLVPEVVTVYTVFHLLFVKGGWRLPLFKGWLVPFPDLQGTWQGQLQTTWKNPHTGEVPPPFPIVCVIRQSFETLSCTEPISNALEHRLSIRECFHGPVILSLREVDVSDMLETLSCTDPRSNAFECCQSTRESFHSLLISRLRLVDVPEKNFEPGSIEMHRIGSKHVTLHCRHL